MKHVGSILWLLGAVGVLSFAGAARGATWSITSSNLFVGTEH